MPRLVVVIQDDSHSHIMLKKYKVMRKFNKEWMKTKDWVGLGEIYLARN